MNQGDKSADRVLVIAYGNPLRCDDGIAWQAAEDIKRKLPSLAIVCVHQLTPELAEEAARADTVIFIDATREGEVGKVSCRAVSADATQAYSSHNLAPAQLLAFCTQLYGTRPRAFLISISGEHFDHGEVLSRAASNSLPQIVVMVNKLLSGLRFTCVQ